MFLFIFGLFLTIGSVIVFVLLIQEIRRTNIDAWTGIWLVIVLLWFLFLGVNFIMYNNMVFNQNIHHYINGNYVKTIEYDANGNEVETKYHIY